MFCLLHFIPFAEQSHLNLFASRPQPKKKRKSRTAFTNHQIFELEKRFLYQKYLSPADRDEIAAALGLSNAQVFIGQQIMHIHKHATRPVIISAHILIDFNCTRQSIDTLIAANHASVRVCVVLCVIDCEPWALVERLSCVCLRY